MDKIDPRFKSHKAKAATRRRGLPKVVVWGGLGLAVIAGGVGGLIYSGVIGIVTEPSVAELTEGDGDADVAYVSPFIDVPGDPLKLELQGAAASLNTNRIPLPSGVDPGRAQGDVVLIRDVMFTRDARLVTTLPTRREDFAFFQEQRAVPIEDDATETQSVNSTSLRLVPERLRAVGSAEVVVRLTEERDLAAVLKENAISDVQAADFASAMNLGTPIAPGSTVAIRFRLDGNQRHPLQMSLYDPDGEYEASAALSDDEVAVLAAADAWIERNLTAAAEDEASNSAQQFRMLDAIYSTALRNGMPTEHLGNAIVLLSRAFDLDAFAAPGDRLVLLYAPRGASGEEGPGQILFAAIEKQTGRLACYVAPNSTTGEYQCFGSGIGGGAAAAPTLKAGMTAPVSGVLRSGFGPRRNPDTGENERHDGIDWAAPEGTPVRAALDGTVSDVSMDDVYGQTITLTHDDDTSTFYAHLSRASVAVGETVQSGQAIGSVGTTGQTDVPHLHFELREAGEPVDPFVQNSAIAGAAVETLVNQIIRVESAGNARAANPNSTARGLGQFIESTWLRMMRTYRPDLVASMNWPSPRAVEFGLAARAFPADSTRMIWLT
ncbi:MAG: M23 family metallopeptidase, partial [Pseudomonadota bacterium]